MATNIFAHRVNTINEVYRNYYERGIKQIEIDVQLTKDNKLVVYHDNVSKQTMKQLRHKVKDIVTFEEFLRHIPDDIVINVELKRYDDRNYVYRVIDQSKKNKGKTYIYSSFDALFVKQIVSMKRIALHLHETPETFDPKFQSVCVRHDILNDDVLAKFEAVYVYANEMSKEDYEGLMEKYPGVKGWIVDL